MGLMPADTVAAARVRSSCPGSLAQMAITDGIALRSKRGPPGPVYQLWQENEPGS